MIDPDRFNAMMDQANIPKGTPMDRLAIMVHRYGTVMDHKFDKLNAEIKQAVMAAVDKLRKEK